MKNKISRRQFLQVTGAFAATLLLASCSGNSASSVSSSSVASSAASSVAASSEAASSAVTSSEVASTVTTTGKTLVVYFSATGTTEGVAQTIADTVGADLFEVVPSDPYTSDDLNWRNNDSRVSREHNDEGLRAVALENTDVDGWDDYDTVFIGYPIWWDIAAYAEQGAAYWSGGRSLEALALSRGRISLPPALPLTCHQFENSCKQLRRIAKNKTFLSCTNKGL